MPEATPPHPTPKRNPCPILEPDQVRAWVRDVAAMGSFDRILTAHFASPIAATPSDFERTFAY